jgi:hypothetical protein
MSESDDYKRGWQRGWNDGFNAAKNYSPMPVYPAQAPIGQASIRCSKCDKVYLPQSCCPQAGCPIQPYMRNS